jgi:hypothetical protein
MGTPSGVAFDHADALGERPDLAALAAGSLRTLLDSGDSFLFPSKMMNLPDFEASAREQPGEDFDRHFDAGRSLAPAEVMERVRAR